jgi:hypothetical protein
LPDRAGLARAANFCFVNRFGRVTQVLLDSKGSQFTEGVLTGPLEIPTNSEQTFYVRHGELFAKICGGLVLLFLLTQLPPLFRRKGESK